MACSQATGFWDKEAEIWLVGAGGNVLRLGRWWDQQCHGGVPTAAAPLAVGTSGGTSGTLLQLEVVRDVCPGYPSPVCNSSRGCDVTAGKGDKKANRGAMARLRG